MPHSTKEALEGKTSELKDLITSKVPGYEHLANHNLRFLAIEEASEEPISLWDGDAEGYLTALRAAELFDPRNFELRSYWTEEDESGRVEIGGTYRHFVTGNLYKVLGMAKLAKLSPQGPAVIYRGENGMIWVRTLDSFMGRVHDDCPTLRFSLLR